MDKVQIGFIGFMLVVLLVLALSETKMVQLPVVASKYAIKEDSLLVRFSNAYLLRMDEIREFFVSLVVRKDYDQELQLKKEEAKAGKVVSKEEVERILLLRRRQSITILIKVIGVIFGTLLGYALLETRKLGK